MITLYYSILAWSLVADGFVCLASANQRPDSISSIIQSYADAFTTSSPSAAQRLTTPLLKIKAADPRFVIDFTTFKPIDKPQTLLPAYSDVQVKQANPNASASAPVVTDLSAEESEEDGDPRGPPDHVIPFSEHENPKEPSTRPNYTAPGDWAKPPKDKDIPLDFVPSKLYAQVRGTHTVKQLPREAAINSAETDEEKENAARLKEVVKVSKANTIYTEEGYEDAAYDHAGQIRDADFHEDFKKKLKEELDRKRSAAGLGDRPKKSKKRKNRKSKSRNFDHFSDDYKDIEDEYNDETRTLKKQVNPEHLKTLKSALSQTVINPKNVVEVGIKELEEDLRKESFEAERTSTEPHSIPTSTTVKPPVTATTIQNKIEYETTTPRRNVYTVRPRKPSATVRPKPYVAKLKNPSKYYKTTNNNYDYAPNLYATEPATTINYSNLFWQYFLDKQNETPSVTYSPLYSETQNINPVITNPLAIATVNGHGPYLVVETTPLNTPSPLESQNVETTIDYVANSETVTQQPTLVSGYIEHNPFFSASEPRKAEVTEEGSVNYSYFPKQQTDNQQVHAAGEERRQAANNYEHPAKQTANHAKMLDYLKNEKGNYYTVMQPPQVSGALVTYPDYSRGPYGNVLEQWSVTHESERPVESVYDVMDLAGRPRAEQRLEVQKSTLPVTRLLPPAPLSSSEYSSFTVRERRINPIPPSVIAIMPIIRAIHKKETSQKSFPFLFRKKRQLGPTREWEMAQRDKKVNDALVGKIDDTSSNKSDDKPSTIKYPPNFEHLLDASMRITGDVIDKEIRERFKDGSREKSNEESGESSKAVAKEEIKDPRNKNTVEVEVPELDFSNIFEEDKPEPPKKKPGIDLEKYPFYRNNKILDNSPLKYIVNPVEVPKKTLGGMEFYDSRNLECEEIDPNLEKLVPEEEELANKRGPRKGKQRLHGLGDKVDCFKAKYFDENPLDNPLFFEKNIGAPSPPTELDPKKFASRILELPPENDDYVIPKGPKTPEMPLLNRQISLRNIPRQYISEQSLHYNYTPRPKKQRPIQQTKTQGFPDLSVEEKKLKSNKTRSRSNLKKSSLRISPAYQRQVYEDVMGTIMNLENMSKTPKRGLKSTYSKHNIRENDREQQHKSFTTPKNRRPMSIDGLVPPPQYSYSIPAYKSSKFPYPNQRYNRHTFHETPIQTFRIFKRSIDVNNLKDDLKLPNKTNNSSSSNNNNNNNNNNNEINKKSEKSIFRIILTTPPPESRKKKRKTVTEVTEGPVVPITQRPIYAINNRIKHSNRSTEDPGKYDKFVENDNQTVSIDIRRKEPRYNKRRGIIANVTSTTSSPVKSEQPIVTVQPSVNTPFSGSTLIPVIVKPDANFTARIPEESKNTYTKQKLDQLDDEEQLNESHDYKDDVEIITEKDLKTPKSQYLVHENIQEDTIDRNDNNDTSSDNSTNNTERTDFINFTLGLDNEEHKELFEFLKGEPPGYNETFGNESSTESDESKSKEALRNEESKESLRNEESKEALRNEESKEDNTQEEADQPEEEERSKEKYVGESTAPDEEEEPQENAQEVKDDDENSSTSSSKADDEPFVRFSSRPYSPPENYEDDKYTDLGPRVNKPSFYHPPFEVPEYERRDLGKVVDRSDDDWGHTEQSEDHEKYVFPWEKDEEDEKEEKEKEERGDESQVLDRYEYPWERRERKAKERKRREKLRKKYGKSYYDSHEDEDEDEDGKEATNAKPVFYPIKYEKSRGKKDVNNVEVNVGNRPVTKFSSKYKSREVKVPAEDDEKLITGANNDAIKQSILNYLEKIGAAPSKIKSHASQKRIVNDTYSTSTVLPSKYRRNETTTLHPQTTANLTTPLAKALRTTSTTSTTAAPTSTSSTPKPPTRVRSRKIRTRVNISSDSSNKLKVSGDQSAEQPSSTAAPRAPRRRGRVRGANFTSTTAQVAPTSPTNFISRRRGRPYSSAELQAVASTTAKARHDRRRRPFKISGAEKDSNSSRSDHSSPTTLSSIPTSTGRTIEHHSRVSKEEIITKTFYPDEDEDDDDFESLEEHPLKKDNVKSASEKKPVTFSKLKRRSRPNKNESEAEHPLKKEKIEKVTITMEETPEHVFKTKEIDKDGVKGKFVTITANNNVSTTKPNDNLRSNDPEIEEIKRKMNAFSSFDSVIRDTDDLNDEMSGSRETENYLVGNLLQKLPLPASRGPKINSKEKQQLHNRRDDEDGHDGDDGDPNDDDDDDDEDDDDDDDDDDDEIDGDGDEDKDDSGGKDSDKGDGSKENHKSDKEDKSKESNVAEKPPVNIIKDPNNRRYFYVESR